MQYSFLIPKNEDCIYAPLDIAQMVNYFMWTYSILAALSEKNGLKFTIVL